MSREFYRAIKIEQKSEVNHDRQNQWKVFGDIVLDKNLIHPKGVSAFSKWQNFMGNFLQFSRGFKNKNWKIPPKFSSS